MDTFLILLVTGLMQACIYAGMSYGFGIIFGVMRIVNVAHGGILMLSMYSAFTLKESFGLNPFLSLLFIVPLFFLLGLVLYRCLVKRIVSAPPISSLLLLFAVWLVMQNVAYLIWTGDDRSIQTAYTYASLNWGVRIDASRFIIAWVVVGLSISLHLFMTCTYFGKALRAAVQNRDACTLVGISVERISMLAFGLGTALSALAGVLVSSIYVFNPSFGGEFLLKSFVVVILGGMESVGGIALGALILGLVEAFSVMLMKASYQDTISFVLLVIILLLLPSGLVSRRRYAHRK